MSIASILQQLSESDAATKTEALDECASTPDPALIDALATLLEDQELARAARETAAVAMARVPLPDGERRLTELAASPEPVRRELGLAGLAASKSAASLGTLISALRDPVNTVRNVGERGLLQRIEQVRAEGIDRLLELQQNSFPLTRYPATRLLAAAGDLRALEPTLRMLSNDTEWLGRLWAAKALGDLESIAALDALEKAATSDEKSRVRAGAAAALGHVRDPRAAAILRRCQQDEDDGVRKAAAEGLEALQRTGLADVADPFAE